MENDPGPLGEVFSTPQSSRSGTPLYQQFLTTTESDAQTDPTDAYSDTMGQHLNPTIQEIASGLSLLGKMPKMFEKYRELKRCSKDLTNIVKRMQEFQTECVLGKQAAAPRSFRPVTIKVEDPLGFEEVEEILMVDLTSPQGVESEAYTGTDQG